MTSCNEDSGVEVEELRVFLAGGGIGSTSSDDFRTFLIERFDSEGEGSDEIISDSLRFLEDLVDIVS